MHWLRFAIVLAVVTFIQASNILHWIALSRIEAAPDLLLMCLVFFALESEGYEAVIVSFALGFAADIISPTFILGPQIISFGLFGSLLSNLRRFVMVRKTMHLVAAVFFCGMAVGVLSTMLAHLKGRDPAGAFVHTFAVSAYSAVVSPYIFAGLGIMSGWLGVKKYHVGR